MRIIRAVAKLALLTIAPIFAQPAPAPRFEVAAIKRTPPDQWNGPSGGSSKNGKYSARNRTVKDYIMRAYFVGPKEISGGPQWIDSDRFDIDAKAEQPVDDDEVLMAMLRTLLAERFKLAIHRETKSIETYVLEAAKGGPKLEKADSSTSSTTNSSRGRIDARATTMKHFAEGLSRQMDFPVIDETGLDGAYNLKLTWTREIDQVVNPGQISTMDSGQSVFTALQQLGLRLRARKYIVNVMLVDHVELPSEN